MRTWTHVDIHIQVGPNDPYQATVVSIYTRMYIFLLIFVYIHIQVGPNDPYQATVVSPLYKNVLTIEGLRGSMMVSGLKMELKSATIHTPSEHKLQGRRMPAEIQFLHEAAVGGEGVKVIVTVFLEIGVTTAPCIQNIMQTVGQFLGTYSVDGYV